MNYSPSIRTEIVLSRKTCRAIATERVPFRLWCVSQVTPCSMLFINLNIQWPLHFGVISRGEIRFRTGNDNNAEISMGYVKINSHFMHWFFGPSLYDLRLQNPLRSGWLRFWREAPRLHAPDSFFQISWRCKKHQKIIDIDVFIALFDFCIWNIISLITFLEFVLIFFFIFPPQ